MLSLAKQLKQGTERGEPLPPVFGSFEEAGIRFRRGSLCMIAGVPGSMKTQLALALADTWRVPTLYISNDSDEATVASRLIARRLRVSTDRVEERMQRDPQWASTQLADVDHIKWNFNPNPTLPEIEEEILAFQEIYGVPPVVVVVDVLMRVDYVEESERGTAFRVTDYLGRLAREYSACVVIVHHCTEAVEGRPCPPRSAVLQKISQLPALILTLAPTYAGLAVACVKNRHGSDDPTGRTYLTLKSDPTQNWFED
jgi:hypothetical protein